MQPLTRSDVIIPFGHPPLPETTRIANSHRINEKARQRPAKWNLGHARERGNETRHTINFQFARSKII